MKKSKFTEAQIVFAIKCKSVASNKFKTVLKTTELLS